MTDEASTTTIPPVAAPAPVAVPADKAGLPEIKVEEKVEPIKEDRQTAKFAELARREAKLENERKALKAQKADVDSYNKSLQKVKSDPVSFLIEQGYNVDQLIEMSLEKITGAKTPGKEKDQLVSRVEEKLKALEDKEKSLGEYQAKVAWSNHLNAVGEYVNKNSEKYEVILSNTDRATELYQKTFGEAEQYLGRGLKDAEVVQVLDKVEQLMTEEYEPLIEQFAKTKKFSSKFAPKAETTEQDTTKADKTLKPAGIKTLTNAMANQSNLPTIANPSKPTSEERLAIIRAKYPKA